MKNKNKKWYFYTLGKICMHFNANFISDSVFFGPVLCFVYFQFDPIFSAPVAGVYYFTFFYHAGGQHASRLFLMKNCESIVMTADDQSFSGFGYDTADNGGNAVFLELQKGDQMCVCLGAKTHVWAAERRITFSGFLVRPM